MRIIIRNLICHRKKNITVLFSVIFSTVLINAYMGNIASSQSQLRKLADITPVSCYITNLNGSRMAGIEIAEETVRQLLKSEYTKDVAYAIRLMSDIGEAEENGQHQPDCNAMGINNIAAIPDLEYDNIHMTGDKEAFFASDENIALISSDILEKHHLKVGDEIRLSLYYYEYDDKSLSMTCRLLETPEVRIAGEIEYIRTGSDGVFSDIILPAGYTEKIFAENGVQVFMDAVSFYIKDPMKLNEAKEEFKSMQLMPVAKDARLSFKGFALNVKDSTFVSLAGNLKKNMALLEFFILPLHILLLLLIFLISFILARNWKKEHITMRLLGISEYQCIMYYCVESLILSVFGVLMGNGMMLLLQGKPTGALYSIFFIAAGPVGTFTASFITGKEMRGKSTWK